MSHINSDVIIRLNGVQKFFHNEGAKTHALAAIDLEIQRGEYLAISGPSGCGKTTLLCILGLLDTMTSGEYLLENQPISCLSRQARAKVRSEKIGFIFQTFNLIGDLTVAENIELPLTYRGIAEAKRREMVQEALETVEMGNRSSHFPTQLSGGQQQRVAVARAVVGKPAILLADEPTGNLDSANGEAVMNLLQALNELGTSICIVTHDARYASHAHRTVELFDGKIYYPQENQTRYRGAAI
ncbi:MAG: ABC transporter ATP-binding protein [Gemmatimonadaceae bacterium]|nr:ABC transporter ATP-binding protein [Gemmatimonadaceae bacterium]